jgi:hypothetical protein
VTSPIEIHHVPAHNLASENTRDRAETRPCGIAAQPESGNTKIVRNRFLIAVSPMQPKTANGSARPSCEAFVRARRGYFKHRRVCSKRGIDSAK